MRLAVRFLRHRGRIIPWRQVANQPARVGDLRIDECRDAELRRYVQAAKLFPLDASRYMDGLPELLDVRIIGMSPQAFTLAGFERVDGAEYAQSWLVTGIIEAAGAAGQLARILPAQRGSFRAGLNAGILRRLLGCLVQEQQQTHRPLAATIGHTSWHTRLRVLGYRPQYS
jgi:hypothetical protein